MASSVSIIIPAFNEEKGIAAVLHALHERMPGSELIVVDDGSTDATAHAANTAGARVLRHPENRGYGRSLKTGILAAAHDIVVITDADGTYPIAEIPTLVERLHDGYDMVVGARRGKHYRGSLFKRPARLFFTWIVEYATGRRIPDINSGLRAFRKKDALPHFPELCEGFSFTTTITLIYMLTGRCVGYMPIEYSKRVGRSKVRMLRDTLRTLQYITEVLAHYNPLKLFLLLILLDTLISAVLTVAFHDLFVAFLGALTALLLAGLGFIAEAARHRS